MFGQVRSILSDETGVTTVEYAMLLAVFVTASLMAWQSLGNVLGNVVAQSTAQIANGAQ